MGQETAKIKGRDSEYAQKKAAALKSKLENVRHIIGVYSGKGGVGKTTVAVNLAVALSERGHSVGFLDADIDCPNSGILFGIKEKTSVKDGMLVPIEKYGIKIVSMDMLIDDNSPVMWRGPMLTKAIKDLLFLSDWGNIDYLVIDLPPGTSDAPLTIMQLLDMDGFIVVTTPQAPAVMDMIKSVNMAKSLGKNVIGIVENMCGDVFGCSGDKNYLAHIPLTRQISESGNSGVPAVLGDKAVTKIFEGVIDKIAAVQ